MMADPNSLYAAHWRVYHQMLEDLAQSNIRLGALLIEQSEMAQLYASSSKYLMERINDLEKRVAELESKYENSSPH